MLGTQIPAGLSLAPALDLRQRPMAQRATQTRAQPRTYDDTAAARGWPFEEVRRRWSVSGYEAYEDL